MTTQISTQTISFNNQALITFEQNGKYYTAMRPICENIGLAWEAQLARIKRDEILSQGMIVMITPSNGGNQQMICLPIEYLNGWLFGIDVNRCKPEIRETLIKYKKECYQALHDYWFEGKAERSQNSQQIAPLVEPTLTAEEQNMLQNAVKATHERTKLSYGEIWARTKNKFKVAKYDQIKRSQLREVLIYLASISTIRTAGKDEIIISADLFEAILKHTRLAKRLAEQTESFHRQLYVMLGLERHIRNDIGAMSYDVAHSFNPWLQKGEEILALHRPLALPSF